MYIERTDSTNTLMKAMLARGEWNEGERLLRTGFQTAGRGQTGNGWESEEGKNLLCSVLLSHQPSEVSGVRPAFYLNVLVSVAVHRVILSVLLQRSGLTAKRSYSEAVTIKWPNDIYYEDRKIAGILIENAIIGSELKYAVAGIGLNVNQTVFVSNAPNPFSLRLIDGKERDIETLSRLLMTEIETTEQQSPEEVWRYYKAHLYRREGFWHFIEREVSIAPTMNYSSSLEERDGERLERPIFLACIKEILPTGEIVLEDQQGQQRTYHFKQVRYVI